MKTLYKFMFKKFSKIFSVGIALVAGRNFLGSVCVQHQGGGVKINYKKIDSFSYMNQLGSVFRMMKTNFCTGFIGFVFYDNGLCSFMLLSEGLLKGSRVFSGPSKFFFDGFGVGSTQKLLHVKLFDTINSFELFPFSGSKMASAAGSYAKMMSKDHQKSILKLKSGWQIKLSNHSLAVLGMVSNWGHIYQPIKKAGIVSNSGVSPTVSGVMKNPCDHPHGGGEGRGSPPVAQVSPWGWLCKGTPTKKKKMDMLKSKLFKSM